MYGQNLENCYNYGNLYLNAPLPEGVGRRMVNFVIALEGIGICMLFVAMGLLLSGDGAREQKMMCLFLSGSLFQNVGYLLELTAPSMEVAVMAVKVEYMGSMFVPVLYCMFMCRYCYETPTRAQTVLSRVLVAVDFVMLPVVFFCDRHDLFYRSIKWLEAPGGYHYLSLTYGPLYVVVILCQSIIPYFLSFYVLLRAVTTRTDRAARRQYAAFLGVSSLPVVALISYAGKLTQVFDLTPLALGLSLAIVAILFWSRRNYDFRNLASATVLNSLGDGVVALDDQKRLVNYNPAALEIFPGLAGRRMGEHIGETPEFLQGILDGEEPRNFDIGERHYESHAKQIVGEGGKLQGYAVLVVDMTNARDQIEEIKRVREQAERANMAKSEFLATMSHEIRTPMNAIIGISDIMMEESRGTRVYLHAKDIQGAAKNLLAIINDILDLSKVESGKMELVTADYHIKGLVGEVVGMMDMAASQRGLVMKYEYDETMPCRYHGDEGRIRQILINLMNNAVKFTRQGWVRVSVRGRPGRAEGEELVVFEVEDTGCGIKPEDQQKIFEDFRQLDSRRNRSVEGTGLGLAIVRHLVQLMDGRIELKSVYGEGSVFTVTIPQRIVDSRPLSEVPEPPARQEGEQARPFSVPGYKVLIVDDNLVNRKVARGFLDSYGFDLTDASSGPEAVELVRKTKYDMIFMDHMMPGMDGIEATQIIREDCGENGTAPIIVALTANAMEGVREKFLASGFQDFIPKPLDRTALNDFLLRWIPAGRRREAREAPPQPSALDAGQLDIGGIDPAMVVKYQAGSLADYQELLELYCMDAGRKPALLRQLVDAGDYKTYEIEVHALKSASANVGARRLSELAREHETAAVKGDLPYIRENLQALLDAVEKQVGDIRAYLDERRGGSAAGAVRAQIDRETLMGEAREALERLEHFRSRECGEIVEDLLEHRLSERSRAALQEIRELLRMYEDDEAERRLREFLDCFEKEG